VWSSSSKSSSSRQVAFSISSDPFPPWLSLFLLHPSVLLVKFYIFPYFTSLLFSLSLFPPSLFLFSRFSLALCFHSPPLVRRLRLLCVCVCVSVCVCLVRAVSAAPLRLLGAHHRANETLNAASSTVCLRLCVCVCACACV